MNEIPVINMELFSSLTENEQGLFLAYRNATLMLFPKDDETNDWDSETIEQMENSAYIFVSLIPDIIKNPPPPATTGAGVV